jgi:integrase
MYKVSKTKVSTGIYKKQRGVYVFSVARGSSNTLLLRHQEQVTGINDQQAKTMFADWLDKELTAYAKAKAKLDQAKVIANGSTVLTFAEYTKLGTIPAEDGQFFTQLKVEATSHKSNGSHRQVTNLQTVQGMRTQLKIVNTNYPAFTSTPLAVITPEAIDHLLDQLKTDRGVTNNTLNHYLRVISKVFILAQEAQLVPKRFNPAREVPGRLKEYRAKTIVTASQYKHVANALLQLRTAPKAGLLIALLCGLRREEIMGLTWESVDLANSTLSVTHTLIKYKNDRGKYVRTLKEGTKNGSVRTVGLPDMVKEALASWYSTADPSQIWRDEVTGAEYHMVWQVPRGLVCQDYFQHSWGLVRKQLIANGTLDQKARFHDLRGGFITYLLNKQHVSPVVVAALAGHKSAKMTLDIYGVADKADMSNALSMLNQALK